MRGDHRITLHTCCTYTGETRERARNRRKRTLAQFYVHELLLPASEDRGSRPGRRGIRGQKQGVRPLSRFRSALKFHLEEGGATPMCLFDRKVWIFSPRLIRSLSGSLDALSDPTRSFVPFGVSFSTPSRSLLSPTCCHSHRLSRRSKGASPLSLPPYLDSGEESSSATSSSPPLQSSQTRLARVAEDPTAAFFPKRFICDGEMSGPALSRSLSPHCSKIFLSFQLGKTFKRARPSLRSRLPRMLERWADGGRG